MLQQHACIKATIIAALCQLGTAQHIAVTMRELVLLRSGTVCNVGQHPQPKSFKAYSIPSGCRTGNNARLWLQGSGFDNCRRDVKVLLQIDVQHISAIHSEGFHTFYYVHIFHILIFLQSENYGFRRILVWQSRQLSTKSKSSLSWRTWLQEVFVMIAFSNHLFWSRSQLMMTTTLASWQLMMTCDKHHYHLSRNSPS